jgi:PAS domain S-box-containing protein
MLARRKNPTTRPNNVTSHPGSSQDAPENRRDKVKRALNNRSRLDAIRRSGLLESTSPIPAFNRAARIAARALRTGVAQVNVLTDRVKLPIAVYTEPGEEEELWRARRRSGNTYCKYVIWTRAPFVVEDASTDELVRATHATRDLEIGAYLAVPIHGPAEGESSPPVLGTVCVMSREPRAWSESDIETLTDIAAGISDEIAYRIRSRDEVRAAENQTIRLLESVPGGMLATDARGVITYANASALRMLGYTAEELVGRDQHAIIHHSHPDGSRYNESDCPNYLARIEGRAYRALGDTLWKSDGSSLKADSVMTPIFDRGEVVGSVLTFEEASTQCQHCSTP